MFVEMFSNFYLTFAGNMISVYSVFLADGDVIPDVSTGKGLLAIGAGLTGIGMIGASIGQGMVGYGACLAIGRNPEVASKITSTLIITAGFCESGAIYALVIALLILFVL